MKVTVHKIHPPKTSKNGNTFIRIEFIGANKKWLKTDVCPDFRNYKHWVKVLTAGAGTVIDNVFTKSDNEVNADSYPQIISMPKKEDAVKPKSETSQQETLY